MINRLLKKTIFISLLGHITVFSVFGLSFGNRMPQANYAQVYFWGQFLRSAQIDPPVVSDLSRIKKILIRKPVTPELDNISRTGSSRVLNNWGEKPPFPLVFNSQKEPFIKETGARFLPQRRPEPTIIFHPLLPYWFALYFKDRQVAHVELVFKTISGGKGNSILVKRKISSGNLEVDLLSLRYIGHYLSIKQANSAFDSWQTVKIDLSAK
ncbi:MAG: hypothetical protein WC723_03090 [Candidatus Omnitrophota bacterium]